MYMDVLGFGWMVQKSGKLTSWYGSLSHYLQLVQDFWTINSMFWQKELLTIETVFWWWIRNEKAYILVYIHHLFIGTTHKDLFDTAQIGMIQRSLLSTQLQCAVQARPEGADKCKRWSLGDANPGRIMHQFLKTSGYDGVVSNEFGWSSQIHLSKQKMDGNLKFIS